MRLFIASTPNTAREAAKYGKPLAHFAYRIGINSQLLRQNLLLQTQGGLLALSDRESPPVDDPAALSQAVLRECGRRSYTGVLLDFEGPTRTDLKTFADQLSQMLPSRRTLYVPEAYTGKNRLTLINTAVSGGTYAERLQAAVARYGGPRQIALDVQRLRMDFTLPAPSGEGQFLSAEAFQKLMHQVSPSTFFSQELCTHYFTYPQKQTAHFVLYDDANSLRQKLQIGAGMGIPAAFLQWPEISDLAPSLFGQT